MTPDDTLLDDLRRVLDLVEGTPSTSTELAKAAITWRSLDAELAELIHDSAIDEHDLVLRGSHDDRRVMSFANAEIQIDVEFANGQLVGQIMPPVSAVIELYRDDSQPVATTAVDEFGAFVLTDVAPGLLALVCRADDGRWSVRTSWTAL